jgi:hypothetical protein
MSQVYTLMNPRESLLLVVALLLAKMQHAASNRFLRDVGRLVGLVVEEAAS